MTIDNCVKCRAATLLKDFRVEYLFYITLNYEDIFVINLPVQVL